MCVFGWRARLFLILLLSRVSFFGWRTRLFFNYYYCHEFCFPGGVRGYFLSSTSIASFVLFRVVCAVLFLSVTNIFEFLFFSGDGHGFLISITITNFVCPGGTRGYFLILLLLLVLFCFFGWRARLFFNYYKDHEFCFSCDVRGYFVIIIIITSFCFVVSVAVCGYFCLLLLLRVLLFFGWCERL